MNNLKKDRSKLRIDLIPPEAILALATSLTYGADKYSDRNWEQSPTAWGRYFAALQRHLWDWQAGNDIDEESGMPTLWCAMACLSFLITYEQRGIGTDDRVPHHETCVREDQEAHGSEQESGEEGGPTEA